MTFKTFEWRIIIRVLLLFLSTTAAAYCVIKGLWLPVALMTLLLIYQVVEFIRFQHHAQEELAQFVQSIQYRDFSRHFEVKDAPAALQPLRQGFNEISSAFKVISKEKETQYQYLQKILELVDTGILSYNLESGEVVWMNESLKQLLQVPYLKTVHSLSKRDEQLYAEVEAIKPGERKIATAHSEKLSFKVLLSATAFNTDGIKYKLVAFQNVNEALDETESKAWQKLLSVMTHEIMNSVAPISSLAHTLKTRLHQTDTSWDTTGTVEDIEIGISTIQRRSEGLLRFAETYRNLNKINTLHLKQVYVSELFANLQQLMQPTLTQKGIDLQIILKEPNVSFQADVNLMEQVLINLLVNAIEAVKEKDNPQITLAASTNAAQKVVLKIADNGSGMPEEVMDKIFIPFFSTKKQGSGIGLSLCKQIVMLHRGTIQVQSKEGEGTVFALLF